MSICTDLYNAILNESINTSSLNTNLMNVLEDILNHDIIINYNKKITIHPYWIELYYFIENNNNLKDPFCDNDDLKKNNNKLYFKSVKSATWNRNRMDICLGKDNDYISILIKRATINNDSTILTDSAIANKVLEFCNMDVSKLTYSFSYNKYNKNIAFTRRVNINNKDKNNIINEKFANKLYAVYDSKEFAWSTSIVD
jgi:hypothetical protein